MWTVGARCGMINVGDSDFCIHDLTAKTHRRDAGSAEFYTKYNLCVLCVSAVK